jgi:hypothetical protein
MLFLIPTLALAAGDLPVDAEPAAPRELIHAIGESLLLADVCQSFGYEVDEQGLADWATRQRDALMAADPQLTEEAAELAINENARNQYKWMYRRYWDKTGWATGAVGDWMETEYRFVGLYAKACKRWAKSPDAARFVAAPAKRPSASQIIKDMREQVRVASLNF